MSDTCPITGDAIITRVIDIERGDYLRWDRADPETHVSVDLLGEIDDEGRAFLDATYEIGELCQHQAGARHARKRPA